MKTILILVDGMRPDALGNMESAQRMVRESASTMDAQTVFPSVTLPCHMSLFHSVDPSRHGTTTNVYMPQVRPIDGLCDVLSKNGKTCAFFYNWEQLRDLARPGSLHHACFYKGSALGWEETNDLLTDHAIAYLKEHDTDFTFLYLGYVDEAGHKYGWMSPEYMEAMVNSWKNIDRLCESLSGEYTVIVTADHGGHDRTHGTTMPEDMLIPIFAKGPDFTPGSKLSGADIKDIAPTVAKLLGVAPDQEWEGKPLFGE